MTRRAGISLALLALTTLVVPSVRGQTDPDVEAATRVVMSQLDAFRRDDYDTAYTFASAMIRDLFDRARFETMVRTGYPEIARSAAAFVAKSQAAPDGTLHLHLRIRGESGSAIEALYEMVREDGQWRINGVVTRPDPGTV
jgi:uncharacterized protein DUF4864